MYDGLRADAVDVLEPGDPPQSETAPYSRRGVVEDRVAFDLRELYVDAPLGRALVRAGKQQIVWGQADGLKVLDVVNPQSFREFILEDFDESRVPLWALNVEAPLGAAALQVVWLPDESDHEIPRQDALYEFTAPMFRPAAPPGVRVKLRSLDRPRRVVADSDAGGRLSGRWRGWDLSLNYFYHYDDAPVVFRTTSLTPQGPLATLSPRYERPHAARHAGHRGDALAERQFRGCSAADRCSSTPRPS